MNRDFVKDVLSIALGGFAGVSLAYSWGSAATLGFLAGGALGYLTRIFTEPSRIAYAGRIAWRHTTAWRPHPEWKMKAKHNLFIAIFLGGAFGTAIAIIIVSFTQQSELRAASKILFSNDPFLDGLAWYVTTLVTINTLMFFGGLLVTFGGLFTSTPAEPPEILSNDRWMAIRFNAITFPFSFVFYTGYAGFVPVAKALYTFAKVFVKTMHSDAFTACAIYAMLTGICIFFFVSPLWYLTLPSAIIGGTVGATMRRVVLRPIPSLAGKTI